MREIPYRSTAAVAYARAWALERNPLYYDFEHIGGDCTNFISQCLYAGAPLMNYTPVTGWYYRSLSDRAPAWSSVVSLHRFLTANQSLGPYAKEVPLQEIKEGDIIQLQNTEGRFYHSLLVTQTSPEICVCAHSYDGLDLPLASYRYHALRCLHPCGCRIP